jgi:hypothetical protein
LKSIHYTEKKKSNLPHILYKEIQSGAVAKSYVNEEGLPMRKCGNISPCIRRPLVIYDFATACSFLNFLIYEENLILFLISV